MTRDEFDAVERWLRKAAAGEQPAPPEPHVYGPVPGDLPREVTEPEVSDVPLVPFGGTFTGYNGPREKCPPGAIPIQALRPDDVLPDGTIRAGAAVVCVLSDGKGGSVECEGRYVGNPGGLVTIRHRG